MNRASSFLARSTWLLTLLTGLVVAGALASSNLNAAEPMRVDITGVQEKPGEITLTAGAYDQGGVPLVGLSKDNFFATLNNVQLPVTDARAITEAQQPVSIVLLVDVSGSMLGTPIQQARTAMQVFVQALDARDRVAVVAFDSRVTLVQDFTQDRAALNAAIAGLNPVGDTALYDAIIEGSAKAAEVQTGRRLIVLLSDGLPTVGLDKRAASLEAARLSGAGFVIVGLGSDLDRQYFSDLSSVTGGRTIDAPTPASLQQTYKDLAAAIRNQYTVTLAVPETMDRTIAGDLVLSLSYRGDRAQAQRKLDPLAGALPPAVELPLDGLKAGATVEPGSVRISASTGSMRDVVKVEYSVDGTIVHTATAPPFDFELDTAALPEGSHLLKAIATDSAGGRGVASVPFLVSVPESGGFPLMTLLIVALVLLALGGAGAGGFYFLMHRTRTATPSLRASRIQSWVAPSQPVAQEASDRGVFAFTGTDRKLSPPPTPATDATGRIVIMNEDAIRAGRLDSVMEFPIGHSPLTLGAGPSNDIVLDDPEGRIGREEARLWVQRGSLVYHKLSTLSAMATEGLTSGWEIFDSGEEVQIGPYRLLYEAYSQAAKPDAPAVQHQEPVTDDGPPRLGDYARGA